MTAITVTVTEVELSVTAVTVTVTELELFLTAVTVTVTEVELSVTPSFAATALELSHHPRHHPQPPQSLRIPVLFISCSVVTCIR